MLHDVRVLFYKKNNLDKNRKSHKVNFYMLLPLNTAYNQKATMGEIERTNGMSGTQDVTKNTIITTNPQQKID